MEINKLYQSIAEGELFHVVSKQTKNDKTYLKFKRHDSIFKYVLLKDKEKARLGTLRVMWQDYLEKANE